MRFDALLKGAEDLLLRLPIKVNSRDTRVNIIELTLGIVYGQSYANEGLAAFVSGGEGLLISSHLRLSSVVQVQHVNEGSVAFVDHHSPFLSNAK